MANVIPLGFLRYLADLADNGGTPSWKAALYNDTLTPTSASGGYSTTNEVTGTGYTAGGVPLTPAASTGTTDGILSFTSPIDFGTVDITNVRWLLIYDNADATKRGVYFDLGTAFDVNGVGLTITLPTADDTDGLIQIELAA